MPKIRDLGINVIPATMRPTEVGGGAAEYQAVANCDGTDAQQDCHPTDPQQCHPPTYRDCHPTDPQCHPPTYGDCIPTDGDCQATPDDQCCPTDLPSSAKDTRGMALPDSAVAQLKQQLQQQIAQSF